MFRVHGYLDGTRVINRSMEHLPCTGDTVRLDGEKYAKVIEIVWCMDEGWLEEQRINVRMKTLAQCPKNNKIESNQ